MHVGEFAAMVAEMSSRGNTNNGNFVSNPPSELTSTPQKGKPSPNENERTIVSVDPQVLRRLTDPRLLSLLERLTDADVVNRIESALVKHPRGAASS